MRYFLVIFILFSCNPARRIQRAEQVVITQPQSFNKVGLLWSTLHPCANDSVRIFVPGVDVVIHDTAHVTHYDSIYNWLYDTLRITHTIRHTDTIRVVVVDRRQVILLEDSINRLNALLGYSKGNYDELNKTLANEKKKARMYLILLVVLIMSFILGVAIKLKKW
jgi:hypothetical protein